MKRLGAASVALTLLLVACGGGVAATVDGETVSVDDVAALRVDATAVPASDFANDLFNLISARIAGRAAQADFGITVTEDAVDESIAALEATLAAQGLSIDGQLEQLGLSTTFLDLFAEQDVLQREVGEALATENPVTEEEARAFFDEQILSLTTACSSHILVETEEEANDVLARLDAGEDFAAVAQEVSTDTGSGAQGGSLGCTPPAQFVVPFAEAVMDAELGVPVGPVESDFGFHVIRVDSRTGFDDVRAQIEGQLAQEAFGEWIIGALRTADVEVTERYGTWVVPDDETLAPSIEPPGDGG